jgi:hypothetical protein
VTILADLRAEVGSRLRVHGGSAKQNQAEATTQDKFSNFHRIVLLKNSPRTTPIETAYIK